mmetsp:Transcript_27369/g.63956  ORF Transcript_27369/g.63956 Transcript_27369/m.63956 type:complete len:261 (-) Transcript_27369:220-1002(-)
MRQSFGTTRLGGSLSDRLHQAAASSSSERQVVFRMAARRISTVMKLSPTTSLASLNIELTPPTAVTALPRTNAGGQPPRPPRAECPSSISALIRCNSASMSAGGTGLGVASSPCSISSGPTATPMPMSPSSSSPSPSAPPSSCHALRRFSRCSPCSISSAPTFPKSPIKQRSALSPSSLLSSWSLFTIPSSEPPPASLPSPSPPPLPPLPPASSAAPWPRAWRIAQIWKLPSPLSHDTTSSFGIVIGVRLDAVRKPISAS